MAVVISGRLEKMTPYELNIRVRSRKFCPLWLTVHKTNGRTSSGFVKARLESGLWCIDPEESYGARWYGLSDTTLKSNIEVSSNFVITDNIAKARSSIIEYLVELEKHLRRSYLDVNIEVVDLE
jgi:hypothetical protein